jgi:hypothetical protein
MDATWRMLFRSFSRKNQRSIGELPVEADFIFSLGPKEGI